MAFFISVFAQYETLINYGLFSAKSLCLSIRHSIPLKPSFFSTFTTVYHNRGDGSYFIKRVKQPPLYTVG